MDHITKSIYRLCILNLFMISAIYSCIPSVLREIIKVVIFLFFIINLPELAPLIIMVFLLWLSAKMIYPLGGKFEKNIIVNDKFEMKQDNIPFLISDMDNNIYKIDTSIWYWQWDLIGIWAKLKKGETYKIKGYGIRSGFWDTYPNIVSIEQINKD